MEFLKPSITHRVEEMIREGERKHADEYKRFDSLLSTLKNAVPEHLHNAIAEIEDMYIKRVEDVEPAYRTGFEDCSKLITFVFRHDAKMTKEP
ncbi:hypothetical protein ACIFOE_21025 [Paenibacillus sp. NRS-1783]|uniref:hypothetical protein n=1 Tax=Paenibacillus sp. NRS-1783 TaxID=3233907 RepID=UPI003D2E2F93